MRRFLISQSPAQDARPRPKSKIGYSYFGKSVYPLTSLFWSSTSPLLELSRTWWRTSNLIFRRTRRRAVGGRTARGGIHLAECASCRQALAKTRAKEARIRKALKKALPDRVPNLLLTRLGKQVGHDKPVDRPVVDMGLPRRCFGIDRDPCSETRHVDTESEPIRAVFWDTRHLRNPDAFEVQKSSVVPTATVEAAPSPVPTKFEIQTWDAWTAPFTRLGRRRLKDKRLAGAMG